MQTKKDLFKFECANSSDNTFEKRYDAVLNLNFARITKICVILTRLAVSWRKNCFRSLWFSWLNCCKRKCVWGEIPPGNAIEKTQSKESDNKYQWNVTDAIFLCLPFNDKREANINEESNTV